MENLESMMSIIGHIVRILALFLPWVSLSIILVEEDLILDAETITLSMYYSNSIQIGQLISITFKEYVILCAIVSVSSAILLVKELMQHKFQKPNQKYSDFFGYLQIFSQIGAMLLLLGIFSQLSDNKLIHPMMSAELHLEEFNQTMILSSQFSFGIYLWIASIVLLGPESLETINLVYSALGGISQARTARINKKINSIIHYYIAEISWEYQIEREKKESRLQSDSLNEHRENEIENIGQNNIGVKSNHLDSEFTKLILKNR